ncbi:MAG: translation initiation factor IF-3 [Spirochaetia bacterium]|nr:translation initiation factor IF-3 [Spirochaetia bacterium]
MPKRRNFFQQEKVKEPRINHQITAQNIRLVVEGKGADIISLTEALKMAEEMDMDLVEISPDQDPPVCKIINFGKWKFEQQKKKKEQSKHQHVIHVKEIKLRPKIGTHDFELKRDQAREFLEKGDKVKVSLRFRGREIAHPELGTVLMEKLTEELSEVSVIEAPPKFEGRQIIMVLASKPGHKPAPKKKPPESNGKKEVVSEEAVENSGSSGKNT